MSIWQQVTLNHMLFHKFPASNGCCVLRSGSNLAAASAAHLTAQKNAVRKIHCEIGHDRSSGDKINDKSYRTQTVCGSIPVCQLSGCSDAASKTEYKSVSLQCLMREAVVWIGLPASFAIHASFPACQPAHRRPRALAAQPCSCGITGDWTAWKERVAVVASLDQRLRCVT